MNPVRKMVMSAVCLMFVASVSHAGILGDIEPGVRGGYYSEGDNFYLGADVKVKVLMVNADPNVEYVFVDNASLWAFNLDGFVNVLPLQIVSVWVGGGVGLLRVKPDNFDAETDGTINLIAGVELGVPLSPYLMGKYIIKDADDITVIGVGVRF